MPDLISLAETATANPTIPVSIFSSPKHPLEGLIRLFHPFPHQDQPHILYTSVTYLEHRIFRLDIRLIDPHLIRKGKVFFASQLVEGETADEFPKLLWAIERGDVVFTPDSNPDYSDQDGVLVLNGPGEIVCQMPVRKITDKATTSPESLFHLAVKGLERKPRDELFLQHCAEGIMKVENKRSRRQLGPDSNAAYVDPLTGLTETITYHPTSTYVQGDYITFHSRITHPQGREKALIRAINHIQDSTITRILLSKIDETSKDRPTAQSAKASSSTTPIDTLPTTPLLDTPKDESIPMEKDGGMSNMPKSWLADLGPGARFLEPKMVGVPPNAKLLPSVEIQQEMIEDWIN